MKKCHKCGAAVNVEKVSRHDECEKCGADLRVCLNCTFYDKNRANECLEPPRWKGSKRRTGRFAGTVSTYKDDAGQKDPRTDAQKASEGFVQIGNTQGASTNLPAAACK